MLNFRKVANDWLSGEYEIIWCMGAGRRDTWVVHRGGHFIGVANSARAAKKLANDYEDTKTNPNAEHAIIEADEHFWRKLKSLK